MLFIGTEFSNLYTAVDTIVSVLAQYMTTGPPQAGPQSQTFRSVFSHQNPHPRIYRISNPFYVCVFITAGPVIKLCAGGERDSEGCVI